MNVRAKKITIEKMESKLRHIRFELKKQKIEKALDGVFDIDDTLEFNASFVYGIYEYHFHKILTLNTKPYSYEYIEQTTEDKIVQKISDDKEKAIEQKQKEIDEFIRSLPQTHRYLTCEEIVGSFRVSPPKSKVDYPILKAQTLENIIKRFISINSLNISLSFATP